MPIGKNSLKRVTNNGYSKVSSAAPDMENSTVIVPDKQTVALVENMVKESAKKAPVSRKTKENTEKAEKKPAEKAKTAAKSVAPKSEKKPAAKKSVAKESAPTKEKAKEELATSSKSKSNREGSGYVNLGGSLPYYLL